MIIRPAGISDVMEIFELLEKMHHEVGEATLDVKKTISYIGHHVRTNRVFIADHEQRVIGALGIEPCAYWYSSETYLVDTFFYVESGFRNGPAGTQLMETARNWAKKLNKPLKIAVINPERAKQRLVPIYGFEPNGYMMTL